MTPAVLITPLGKHGGTGMRWLEAKREGEERGGAGRGKEIKTDMIVEEREGFRKCLEVKTRDNVEEIRKEGMRRYIYKDNLITVNN